MRDSPFLKDVDAFAALLRADSLFAPGTVLTVARAPGRLDVMGGIADYSGSLVLQRPLAEATFAALQKTDRPEIQVESRGRAPCAFRLDEFRSYEEARTLFRRDLKRYWASYVLGVFLVLERECGIRFPQGAKVVVASAVPAGKGVSSSAALEAAVMQAVCGAFHITLEPREMARLCQTAENRVAGAPCGIMDQTTAICGEAGSLLALLCQPAELQAPVPVPDGLALWGIDSGERHAVSGGDYGSVRTGAFMGLRIVAENHAEPPRYLANIPPSEFEREYLPRLPEEMTGAEFLARYGGTADTVTRVDPQRLYKVRRPAAHPVYEHQRVMLFRELLLAPHSEERARLVGELMRQSHESYTACGLGSRGTDLIVELVRGEGPANGLYGARITGGGSGGTVAVLGRSDAGAAIARIVEAFEKRAGYRPYVFSGSSAGSARFGSITLTL